MNVLPAEDRSRSRRQPRSLGEGEYLCERSLRDDGEVDVLACMLRGALELIEKSDAGRAWAFLKPQERGLTARRSRPFIARVAREHEAVDHE